MRSATRARPLAVLLAALVAYVGIPLASADRRGETETELKEVRSRIERVRAQVNRDLERRDSVAVELRRAELAIQGAGRRLAEIRAERRDTETRLAALRTDRAATVERLAAERRALAAEVRVAYMNGRRERIKLLLVQDDPEVLGRMMVYYRYFGQARATRIASVSTQLAELDRITAAIEAQTRELARLEERQVAEVARLEAARTERGAAIAALELEIKSRQTELARLDEQAKTLENLLVELRRAAEEFPMLAEQPFEKTRGRLPWPVRGKLTARFGETRAGGPLRWQGIVIDATRGADVRAPHYGRVIYGDWLPGMGLLIVLDHGDGYMSLYGRNERIYRTVGDRVAPGDVIAAVGDSGGHARAGLYVEIRKGKTPLDPLKWLRKP